MDYLELNNGVKIPVIGNGPASVGYTTKYKRELPGRLKYISKAYTRCVNYLFKRDEYVDAVAHSFRVGFNLLDYSASYGDGSLIRKAINKSGLNRTELFLTTRVSNRVQESGEIRRCLMQQLQGLGTDYIDLLMFHWPVPEYYLETWRLMTELYEEGYCRAIGVANCHEHHLEKLASIGDIVPAVNQFEVHPLFTQKELIDYCHSKGIAVQGYTAIARMDDRLMHRPSLKNIAEKYNKSIVQIVLRWHIQSGIIPIVRSLNKKRQLENISIFDFKLTNEEMLIIDKINIDSRLRHDPDNCDFSIL